MVLYRGRLGKMCTNEGEVEDQLWRKGRYERGIIRSHRVAAELIEPSPMKID